MNKSILTVLLVICCVISIFPQSIKIGMLVENNTIKVERYRGVTQEIKNELINYPCMGFYATGRINIFTASEVEARLGLLIAGGAYSGLEGGVFFRYNLINNLIFTGVGFNILQTGKGMDNSQTVRPELHFNPGFYAGIRAGKSVAFLFGYFKTLKENFGEDIVMPRKIPIYVFYYLRAGIEITF